MEKQPNKNLSKRHMMARLEFARRHIKNFSAMRNKILWSDEIMTKLFGLNDKRHWSSPGQLYPCGEAQWWQHHTVEVFLQQQETCPDEQITFLWKLKSSQDLWLRQRVNFQWDNDPKQYRGFGTSLWMSLSGPGIAWTWSQSLERPKKTITLQWWFPFNLADLQRFCRKD